MHLDYFEVCFNDATVERSYLIPRTSIEHLVIKKEFLKK